MIVNVSTSVRQRARPGSSVYAATKTALELLTRALRHYEHTGLISSGRAPNGYRIYGERQGVAVVRQGRPLLPFDVIDPSVSAQRARPGG